MFSFAAYAGGMVARGGSVLKQVVGALTGGIGIFLPGLFLIYFVNPVWENIKRIRAVKVSLKGINAVAGGMILTTALILMQANGFNYLNTGTCVFTVAILITKKVPAPFLVLFAIIAGSIL